MGRRQAPEISAGSMADIAFLLLIFFLVTTTMEKESGIMRLLPEITNTPPEQKNQRNVIDILVNDKDQILLKGEEIKMEQVKSKIAELILNKSNNPEWPERRAITAAEIQENIEARKAALANATDETEKTSAQKSLYKAELRMRAFENFGNDFIISKHVVSIQSTRGAEYKTYIELNDQILQSYKFIKENLAQKKWDKTWKELSKDEKEMLNLMFPTSISEAQTVSGKR